MSIVTHKMYIVHPYNILCEIFTVLCSAFLLFSVWCHCWKAIFSPLLLLYSKKLAKIIYALHRNFGVFSRVILNNSIKSKQTGLTVALSHKTVMLECDLEQEREKMRVKLMPIKCWFILMPIGYIYFSAVLYFNDTASYCFVFFWCCAFYFGCFFLLFIIITHHLN